MGCIVSCHENGQGGGLGAFDALGVVVGHLGGPFGLLQHLVHSVEGKPHRRHPHGRPVAETAVRLVFPGPHPLAKTAAIAPVGMILGILFEGLGKVPLVQNGIRHRHGQHRVVGEPRNDDLEILAFDAGALVGRSDHVACDGTDHVVGIPFLFKFCGEMVFRLLKRDRRAVGAL